MDRRAFVRGAAVSAGAIAGMAGITNSTVHAQLPRSAAQADFKATKQRIRQSVMGWCFSPMPATTLAKHCREMGIVAIEGIPREAYKPCREMGLEISLAGSHGFAQGPCDPKFREVTHTKLLEAIDAAVEVGCKRVITFTGMRFPGMDEEQAAKDCVEAWKKVLPIAERKGITLCLEHLNSRDGSHPMKGHPGYFGDDVDFCVDLIKRVGSPNFRLLFDIYHVSIMNGDVIRRIRQYKEYIAHYHTAGNPGRCELDDSQEINYPAVMRAILETGYDGYVAQEFIPTWDDPIAALRHAVQVCDV